MDPKKGELRNLYYPAGRSDFKWKGWHQHELIEDVTHFRMSFWIMFNHKIPRISENCGVKMHGKVYNDWINEAKKGKWLWVSEVSE